jgi:hypothetical protein
VARTRGRGLRVHTGGIFAAQERHKSLDLKPFLEDSQSNRLVVFLNNQPNQEQNEENVK